MKLPKQERGEHTIASHQRLPTSWGRMHANSGPAPSHTGLRNSFDFAHHIIMLGPDMRADIVGPNAMEVLRCDPCFTVQVSDGLGNGDERFESRECGVIFEIPASLLRMRSAPVGMASM